MSHKFTPILCKDNYKFHFKKMNTFTYILKTEVRS